MSRLTAFARFHCPQCEAETVQHCDVTLARPGVLWSTCGACAQITIWEEGRCAFPPRDVSRPPLAFAAAAALLLAAGREHETCAARLADAREELAALEQQRAGIAQFVQQFGRYRARPDASPAAPSGSSTAQRPLRDRLSIAG
jgi:hypothetical protein